MGGLLARTVVTLVALVSATATSVATAAWNGERDPNDPKYNIAERDPNNHSFHEEQWHLYSFLPKTAPLAVDAERASGMSADKAWRTYGSGRPDVKVAYIEGGVNWRQEEARVELAPRSALNTAELPVPEGASSHDANGDGQVNVVDYADDTRIARPYLHGTLTPEDLIVAFSDGTDADGNGYVDDIAGWNFNRNTNDPQTEDSAYTHANNQMIQAVAEGDNGYDGVGVCPRCTVIPVKSSDEALVRPDRLAQSIYFSVDSGASVIVAVVAELGYSELTRAALQYAWDKGVVVVEASNDFNSTDHQAGMFWPRVWPGNGIVASNAGKVENRILDLATRSFRNRSNYSSFGTHSLFSVPSNGGTTSEATPTAGGVAALVASFGRRAADEGRIGAPLDAGEIKEVVRATASNIDQVTTVNYPGRKGATFNVQYGYGRPNLARAADAVRAGRIPPVPDILSPDWYAHVDPTTQDRLPIRVDLAGRRAARMDWRVEWAVGPEPTEREFSTLATGSTTERRLTGQLAVLDLADVPESVWNKALRTTATLRSTEQHTVTLRVRVTDDEGVMGEDRRSVAVQHDPDVRSGYPRRVGLGSDGQPTFADLDGDGAQELISGDTNGLVHVRGADGRELPGWPARTLPLVLGLNGTAAGRAGRVPAAHEPVLSPPAVGDLDGDGTKEIVLTSTTGRVYAFNRDGSTRAGFPRAVGAQAAGQTVPVPDAPFARQPSFGAFAPPVLAALPGGSALDIVQAAWDGRLYGFDGDGADVPGWPVDAKLPAWAEPKPPLIHVRDRKLIATPTLAQLDGKGPLEVVIKSQEFGLGNRDLLGLGSRFFVMAFWADGNRHEGGALVPGWPAKLTGTLGYYGSAQDWITEGGDNATAVDADRNGRDEIIQPTVFNTPTIIRTDAAGRPASTTGVNSTAALASGLFSTSAQRILTVPGVGASSSLGLSSVGFTASGAAYRFRGRDRYVSGGTELLTMLSLLFPGQPLRIENAMRSMSALTLRATPGFPTRMMGLPFITAPAVADLTGDGRPEVISATDTSNVAAWEENGRAAPGWPKFTAGWTLVTPAIGDIDADGFVDVAAQTREGELFVWKTKGRVRDIKVPTWHQDVAHSGRVAGPLP